MESGGGPPPHAITSWDFKNHIFLILFSVLKVQVHVTLSHGEVLSRVHSPAAVWVQSVSTREFESLRT